MWWQVQDLFRGGSAFRTRAPVVAMVLDPTTEALEGRVPTEDGPAAELFAAEDRCEMAAVVHELTASFDPLRWRGSAPWAAGRRPRQIGLDRKATSSSSSCGEWGGAVPSAGWSVRGPRPGVGKAAPVSVRPGQPFGFRVATSRTSPIHCSTGPRDREAGPTAAEGAADATAAVPRPATSPSSSHRALTAGPGEGHELRPATRPGRLAPMEDTGCQSNSHPPISGWVRNEIDLRRRPGATRRGPSIDRGA
jgi:hypothetical protein